MLEVKVSNRDSYLNISPSCLGSVGMLSSIFYRQVYTAQCIDKLEINLVSFTTGADSRNLLANGCAGQLPLFPPPKKATVHRGRRSRAAKVSTCPHACFEARSRPPGPPGFYFQYQLPQKCRAPWESLPTSAISPGPTTPLVPQLSCGKSAFPFWPHWSPELSEFPGPPAAWL